MEISTFTKLKEKEKNARRNIIIDAAEKEFASKPFNRVNMRDIAKKAGISPASIYRYFPDQQSLFVEAFVRGTKDIFTRLHEIVDSSEDGAFERVTEEFIDYFTRNDQYFRMMMHFFLDGSVDTDVFDKLTGLERKLLLDFDTIFEKIRAKGNIRFNSHTLFSTLVGIVATFRNHPGKSENDILKHRQRIGQNITRLFLNNSKK